MSARKMEQLLSGDGSLLASCENLPAELWRRCLYATNMSWAVMDDKLNNYVQTMDDIENNVGVNDIKGNLLKALCRTELTWAILVRGLLVINYPVTEITMSILRKGERYHSSVNIRAPGYVGNAYRATAASIKDDVNSLQPMFNHIKEQIVPTEEEWVSLILDHVSQKDSPEPLTANLRARQLLKRLSTSEGDVLSWNNVLLGFNVMQADAITISVRLRLDNKRTEIPSVPLYVNATQHYDRP